MSQALRQGRELVDWGMASRPLAGQATPGDRHLVQPFAEGVLLAVIDGLGHGSEASLAAETATKVLQQHAGEPVDALIESCHEALRRTRGAVMTLASLSGAAQTLTWLAVGNVEGRLWHADPHASPPCEQVLLRGGLVGYHLPPLQAMLTGVSPGDVLVLASDGVRGDFTVEAGTNESPRDLAAHILERHFKGTDDGLVLVARYLGDPA